MPWAETGPLHSRTEAFLGAPCGERQTVHSFKYCAPSTMRGHIHLSGIILANRWYSLQNQIHSFFAVLPLKWKRSGQHFELRVEAYGCHGKARKPLQISECAFITSSFFLPLVPQMTTSRRCGCAPACSPLLVPCTPQYHKRNKLSSHGRWLLYISRNLKKRHTVRHETQMVSKTSYIFSVNPTEISVSS